MGSLFMERMSSLSMALDEVKEAAYACLDPGICENGQQALEIARELATAIEAFAGDCSACGPDAARPGGDQDSRYNRPNGGIDRGFVSGLPILLNTLVAEREFLDEYGTYSMPDREFRAQAEAMLRSVRAAGLGSATRTR